MNDKAPGAIAMTGRKILATLCVLEFLLSFMFLVFIHQNHGAPGGDFREVCRNCGLK